MVIEQSQKTAVRRYPSVLEPAELTTLSFEVAGKLETLNVNVGQSVKAGDLLATVNPETLNLQKQEAEAAVRQAQANYDQAMLEVERQETLFKKGAIPRANLDAAKTQSKTAKAALDQAKGSLERVSLSADKSELRAPFDGIVNSVQVDVFTNVGVGTPVVTLYSASQFEASFSVSFEVVNQLVVGKPATITLADLPEVSLPATVTELGSRAESVSSFPVILTLDKTHPSLKAGMAIEVAVSFDLPAEQGYAVPISAIAPGSKATAGQATLFVFDPDSSTVSARTVHIGGISQNSLVVIDGLDAGEIIATAGTSFLREGQTVKRLD